MPRLNQRRRGPRRRGAEVAPEDLAYFVTPGPSQSLPIVGDPTTEYATSVVDGRTVAGRLVRLACERHLRDLDRAAKRARPVVWDLPAAHHGIGYFRDRLRLNGGEFEGKPFVLGPWQSFIVGSLFGWKEPAGTRRFRVAYVESPKGSGKSPLAGGVGLLMMTADLQRSGDSWTPEARAEVYAAAVDKEQARILFRDAVAMVDLSPELSARIQRSGGRGREWRLAHAESGSFFLPISSENQGRGKSGPRPHCVLLDEVHEHKTSAMVEFMRAGTKGRRQALIFMITNSGFDRQSVCWHHHEYGRNVLEGLIEDDSRFAYICGLDACDRCRKEGKEFPTDGCPDCDDWRDESTWPKVNPNLDVSIPRRYLREQVREASGMPSKASIVKRLNFCIWTDQEFSWMPAEEWQACAMPGLTLESLRGRRCYSGVDLAGTSDLAAMVLVFPPAEEGEPTKVLAYFWLPKDCIDEKERSDRVPYRRWVDAGLIEATEGSAIDQRAIRRRINWLREEAGIDVHETPYDPDDATQFATDLIEDGFTPVPFYQTKRNFTAPIREVEKEIAARTLAHDGNEVLALHISNAALEQNAEGQVKFSKIRAKGRMDGAVALAMAKGRAMLHPATSSVDTATGYML